MKNQDLKTADALQFRYQEIQAELLAQGRLDESDIALLALRIAKEIATNEQKVEVLESFLNVEGLFPRKCDVTGKGMNEGFVVYEDMYIAEENDIVAELRKYYSDMSRPEVAQGYKDDAVRELAYEEDVFFFTEWNLTDELNEGNFFIELSTGDVIEYEEYLIRFIK